MGKSKGEKYKRSEVSANKNLQWRPITEYMKQIWSKDEREGIRILAEDK